MASSGGSDLPHSNRRRHHVAQLLTAEQQGAPGQGGDLRARWVYPVSPRTWREWDDLAGVFDQPTDPGWADDRDLLDDAVTDPWVER